MVASQGIGGKIRHVKKLQTPFLTFEAICSRLNLSKPRKPHLEEMLDQGRQGLREKCRVQISQAIL